MVSKDYFKHKMRLYRKRHPLSQRKYVYSVKIGDNEFVFLRKSDIVIERKHINACSPDANIIKMF